MKTTSETPDDPNPADPSQAGTLAEEDMSDLAVLLEQYLADLDAGLAPDRERLLADHPQLATQIGKALDGLEFIHRAKTQPESAPATLGDFRIVREVGRGGMGVVYEAEQISLKRRIALKVLRFGAVADEMAMQRFQREAETVAQLHHTNIVPIFAIGSEEGVRYYAMQFIEGRDLAALVRDPEDGTRREVEPREIAGWGLQAAEALAHAHRRGVIHRDIKPSNLILDDDGRIWLTDFGLARRVDDVALSIAGALVGTPRYMSPEQARASTDPVDHRTDIYSLGATLYELATRRPIFDATSPHEVITQILHAEPRAPHLVAPGLPRDLETVIMKCLAKEPRARYATAQALADDLRAFLEGRAISARPPTVPERVVRWTRRHRKSVTAGSVSAAVSLVLMLGGYLGWQQHRESREGRLLLRTSGPNLVAEVLDANDRAVLPAFPVPSQEPVRLPEGTYRVRLSASGLISETWPLDIRRGETEQPSLQLDTRWLWPPRELSTGEMPDTHVVALDGSADVVQLTQATLEKTGRRYEQKLQRFDGATGFPVWEKPLVFDEANVPPGLTWAEWQRILWPPNIGTPRDLPRLVQPAPDLDGDGTGDLVWTSRHFPSLGAVSGADGRVLWWYRGLGVPRDNASDPVESIERSGQGALVGLPAVADVDGDGTMDFFACYSAAADRYRTRGGKRIDSGGQSWVALVSGKTGAESWRQPVGEKWERYGTSSSDHLRGNSLCRPRLAQAGGRSVFVLAIGAQLHAWEARTGEPAWPAQELAFEPRFAPDVADLDGDGESEMLLVRVAEEAVRYDRRTVSELVAWSPKKRAELWRREFLPAHQNSSNELQDAIEPFHRLEDLDGKGPPEVLLPVGSWRGWQNGQRWRGLEALDGATGQPRWMTRLAADFANITTRTVDAIATGPDLDGDGFAETFVAWNGFEKSLDRAAMHVAALSGATGAMLWQSTQPVPGPARSLQWWHAGPDGWPMLIVPTNGGPGGQDITYFLSTSDGRVQHTLPDVAEVTPADLDSDGIADLFYTVYPQGAARHLAVRGAPPAAWRRLGLWRAGGDYDGDGFTDLFAGQSANLAVRSGRDGRKLWQSTDEIEDRDLSLALSGPAGDLDRDGAPDFIGRVRDWERGSGHYRQQVSKLAAISGKDGRRIWTAGDFEWSNGGGSSSGRVWSYKYPFLDAADIDADGRAETLLLQYFSNRPFQLTAFSGADGRVLWHLPVVKGGWAPTPSPGGRPLADLNADGVLDVILWRPTGDSVRSDAPCELAAWDGRSGQMLWSVKPAGLEKESQIAWPEPSVGDLDGDGLAESIVAVHHGYEAGTGYRAEILALDGRTGATRWTWKWTAGFPDLWPPLVLSDRDGARFVAVCLQQNDAVRIVVLRGDGTVARELPITTANSSFPTEGAHLWRSVDLDGDGSTELLFGNEGRLMAARGPRLETVWSWDLPEKVAHLADVRPATPGRSAELTVWSGNAAYGLSGGTGRAVWRSDLPGGPRSGMSDPPELFTLQNPAHGGLPAVQLWWPGNSEHRWATVCRQAWPVADTGAYRAPQPAPRAFTPLPAIPAPGQPLPWTTNRNALALLCSGLLALAAAAIPAWLIWLGVRRGPVLPGFALAAYAAVSVLIFGQGIVPVAGFGFGLWMLWRAAREKSWPRGALALFYTALAITPMLVLASSHYLRPAHHWGAWWWLDEWFLERLALTLITVPGLAFWVHLALAIRARDWGKMRTLLIASVVLAVVAASIMVAVDRAEMQPGEVRSWAGWWSIWFAGAWLTGLGSLLVFARRAWKLWRARRGTPLPASATAA